MKTITCRQMGGMCDEKLSADTYEGMLDVGMKHVEAAHAEMAESIKKMPKDHPMMVEWEKNFRKTWEETPVSE
jgi:hypothetical protein